MNVVSVNVGEPREVPWRGRSVLTSIFKAPVAGRVAVRAHNVEGDRQSDLTVHGGADKAVYAYPSEHYAYWRDALPGVDLPWGAFGENLTTTGLLEAELRIGDRLRVGSTELVVTQPRIPCFKLGIRLGRTDMPKRFLASGRSGFYLRIVAAGEVAAGDPIAVIERDAHDVTVADVVALKAKRGASPRLLRQVVDLPALSEAMREEFRKRL